MSSLLILLRITFVRVKGSNLLLFVASAYKYFKKGDSSFVIVYKLDASYKFLDQMRLKKGQALLI